MGTGPLNGAQLAKMKKSIPDMGIYRDEAVGLEKLQIYLKNYDLCEYVEFGAISWKFDILSITAQFKFESNNSFEFVWYI